MENTISWYDKLLLGNSKESITKNKVFTINVHPSKSYKINRDSHDVVQIAISWYEMFAFKYDKGEIFLENTIT